MVYFYTVREPCLLALNTKELRVVFSVIIVEIKVEGIGIDSGPDITQPFGVRFYF